MTAKVNSLVVAWPPISFVRTWKHSNLAKMSNFELAFEKLYLSSLEHSFHSASDHVSVKRHVNVVQHFSAAQQHGGWIGHILAHGLRESMPCTLKNHKLVYLNGQICFQWTYGLKDNTLGAPGGTSNDSSASNKASGQVVDDVAVQVGHDADVKLTRVGHHLHCAVVHDHGLELDLWVQLGDFLATAQEQTVTQLHDVGLVDSGDLSQKNVWIEGDDLVGIFYLLPVVFGGVVEGKLCNPSRVFPGYNFQALNNTLEEQKWNIDANFQIFFLSPWQFRAPVLSTRPRSALGWWRCQCLCVGTWLQAEICLIMTLATDVGEARFLQTWRVQCWRRGRALGATSCWESAAPRYDCSREWKGFPWCRHRSWQWRRQHPQGMRSWAGSPRWRRTTQSRQGLQQPAQINVD